MRTFLSIAYLASLSIVLGLNVYAIRNPQKLIPLTIILSGMLDKRSTRLALAIIWWWLGWHFLYAPL